MRKKDSNNPSDIIELIDLVVSGDSDAFSILVEKYRPLLKKLLRAYTTEDMSDEDVQDLEQEGLIAFYRAIITFDKERVGVEFGLYAKICITNSMISYKRAVSKKTEKIALVGDEEIHGISDPDQEIARIVEIMESERALEERIEKTLSPFENEVWLYYVNGYSSREIAVKLNSNEKSIDNAIFRIRRKLKTLLNKEK